MNRWLPCWYVLFAALVVSARAGAHSESESADKTLSPYFFVEDGDPAVDALPLESTKVAVQVSTVIADVTVTQTYKNDGTRPINARYVFPASTRAAVHGLTMKLRNEVIVATIKERQAAKQEYEAAKEAGKNAALLEQERPNVFSMRVANVMPEDRIEVTLRYTELLVPTDGLYEFVYPTVVGPRYSNELKSPASPNTWVETPYLGAGHVPTSKFELSGTLSTGMPIVKIASPSHKITEARAEPSLSQFALADPAGENRDFILRYGLAGGAIQSGLMLYESGGEKFFLMLVEPPERVVPADLPPREYVFVLDVSGSMIGFPLDTAKQLLKKLSRGLRPQDKFNVILFSGGSNLLATRSIEATPENVAAALRVIDGERGGGGTELLPALERAMSLSPEPGISRSFIVVTDGYISADKEAIDYVRAHLGDANVFSFGIGTGVNRYLVEGLAKAGEGEPFVVTAPIEATDAATRFQSYVESPVLTDIRVRFDGFDAYEVEPKTPPDVFARRPVVVHGKWRGKPEGAITVTGVSGKGPYSTRLDVAKTAPRAENKALEYLWARDRIARLGDFGFGEPDEASKSEITALGLRYSLLTEYTSFIAVSHVVVNPNGDATSVKQPVPMPAGVSNAAIGMQEAPEPELLVLLVLLAALGATMHRLQRCRSATS